MKDNDNNNWYCDINWTSQLNAGEKALVPRNNDKNTVLALREIGDGKISLKTLEDAAINKLRKIKSQIKESEDLEIDQEDEKTMSEPVKALIDPK